MTTFYTYPAPTPTKGNSLSDIAEGPEGLTQDLALSLNRPAIERPNDPGKSQPRKLDLANWMKKRGIKKPKL